MFEKLVLFAPVPKFVLFSVSMFVYELIYTFTYLHIFPLAQRTVEICENM